MVLGSPPREWGTAVPSRGGRAILTVHPHASGDSVITVADGAVLNGSPPREWGTATVELRNINEAPVHPHASGDSHSPISRRCHIWGSPPREWGQRYKIIRDAQRIGFTPTRVGTAVWAAVHRRALGVHPHASGDSPAGLDHVTAVVGSPPREWGQLVVPLPPGEEEGFTPTRVGTAGHRCPRQQHTMVHPHASGDSETGFLWEPKDGGSPPREWGQPNLPSKPLTPSRFTPTRVGTATANWVRELPMNRVKVHPHASGDSDFPLGLNSLPLCRVHPHASGDSALELRRCC